MPHYNVILNLPGFTVTKVSGPNPIVIHAKYHRKPQCMHCGNSRLRIKDSFFRQVKHESIGSRNTVLRFKSHKLYCRACHRYFNQQFPGILKHQRATEKLRQQVFREHTQGVSQTDLAKQLALGKSTVERWFHAYYYLQNQNKLYQNWPKVLGIDEHFFTKKDKLQQFLNHNPAIQALYLFKEQLLALLKHKHQKARQCKQLIPDFLDMIKQLKTA